MTIPEYLNETVWARLAPSKIHGIGVFAIRDIPQGTRYTDHSIHHLHDARPLSLDAEEFDKIEPEIRALILDRCMFNATQDRFSFYSPNVDACLNSFMNHNEDNPNTADETS